MAVRLLYNTLQLLGMILVMLMTCSEPIYAQEHSNDDDNGKGLLYSITEWNEQQLDDIIIVDANSDGSTWELFESATDKPNMRYRYNKYNAADDYLYLHPIALQSGISYEAVFYVHAGSTEYEEEFSLGIVHGRNISEHITLLSSQQTTSKDSRCYKVQFTVASNARYRLYIHCTSPANHHMLYLDSLSVVSSAEGFVPNAIEDLTLVSNERTPHVVTIQCTAPTHSTNAQPLEQLDEILIYRNDRLIGIIEHPQPGEVISYNDTLDTIDHYTYKVLAKNHAGAGNEATKSIVAGIAPFPFRYNFSDGMGFFNITDNNADGVTWHYHDERFGGCMRYTSSALNNADDWLFAPPVYLDGSMRYQVEYSCCVGLSSYPESMSVMLGFTPNPQDMSLTVSKLHDFSFIKDTVIVAPFEVHVPGIYYIAFHAYSRADSYAILLRSIEIDEYDPNSVSSPVTHNIVRGGTGCIEIITQEAINVRIYNLLGEEVNTFIAHSNTRYETASGIYIVHAGKTIQKIVVL